MPSNVTFHSWLGTLFGQPEPEVCRLLEDGTALHFLVAWSLFESKCFKGFVKAAHIECYARETSRAINYSPLDEPTAHFHARYQNRTFFDNLMHGQKNERLSRLLKMSVEELNPEDKLFLLVLVVYRYRNNIFHGNKGVNSWLRYREQIQYCIQSMQFLISHAERVTPTMKADAA